MKQKNFKIFLKSLAVSSFIAALTVAFIYGFVTVIDTAEITLGNGSVYVKIVKFLSSLLNKF